jgi:hypothetical protein
MMMTEPTGGDALVMGSILVFGGRPLAARWGMPASDATFARGTAIGALATCCWALNGDASCHE